MRKTEPIIFLAVMFAVTLAAFLQSDFIEEHGIVAQVWVTVILVLLTAVYVSRVRQQADASVKMAEEMREQRYDSVRPIIDIERKPESRELAKQAYGDFSEGLLCILRNIGVGPATDVYSFVHIDCKCQLHPFGALAKNGEIEKLPLSLKQRNGRNVLVAYYRDVYDRCFESSREVKKGVVQLGPLEIRKIPKEECPK